MTTSSLQAAFEILGASDFAPKALKELDRPAGLDAQVTNPGKPPQNPQPQQHHRQSKTRATENHYRHNN
jgi:hypothetical protein